MTATETQEDWKKTSAMSTERTGEKSRFKKKVIPFFGHSTLYNLVDPFNLGADLQADRVVVQLVYDPPETNLTPKGNRITIAGYVSCVNDDLSELFSTDAYRIGVEMGRVVHDLKLRIKAGEEVIAKGGEKSEGVDEKVEALQTALETAQELDNNGWTHLILATAWRQYQKDGGFVDRLDMNFDFFDIFYPEKGFPMPSLNKGLGPRSFFIWGFFPEGKVVDSMLHGIKLWNRYDYRITSSSFPKLRITFNHAPVDVLSQDVRMYGRKEKLRVQKKWPTVAEVVEELEEQLKNNIRGAKAARNRKRAMKWAEKFLRRSIRLKKKKKYGFAEKNEKACEELMNAVRENLDGENDELVKDLEGVEDPMSKQIDVLSRKALKNRAEAQMLPSSEDEDKRLEDTLSTIVKKHRQRAEVQLEDIENTSPDDPKFNKKVGSSLGTHAKLQQAGDDDGTLLEKTIETARDKLEERAEKLIEEIEKTSVDDPQFKKKNRQLIKTTRGISGLGETENTKLIEDTINRLSKSVVERITHMVNKRNWRGQKMLALLEQNRRMGKPHKLPSEIKAKLKNQNTLAMENHFAKEPMLTDKLKPLIKIHIIFLNAQIPNKLLKNTEIRDYVNKIKRRKKRKQDYEMSLMKDLEIPERNDPDVIK